MANETDTTITGGTDEQPDAAAVAKAAEEKLNADVAKLELKLPDGFDAKDATLADFKKLAVRSGLDSQKSQGLFDFHHKTMTANLESAKKQLEQSFVDGLATARKGWRDELAKDKDFGGAKLEATKQDATKVFLRYAERIPELKADLEQTGWGDKPSLVKLFALIGRDLADDTVARKGSSGASAATRKAGQIFGDEADLKALFPNSSEMFDH